MCSIAQFIKLIIRPNIAIQQETKYPLVLDFEFWTFLTTLYCIKSTFWHHCNQANSIFVHILVVSIYKLHNFHNLALYFKISFLFSCKKSIRLTTMLFFFKSFSSLHSSNIITKMKQYVVCKQSKDWKKKKNPIKLMIYIS